MSKISVVIPLFNKEKTIQSTLKAVLSQTSPVYEIVVVNDGSTDESAKIVTELNIPNLSLIRQKNQGAAAARNTGIQQAKGDFIAFLDADDYWYPNYLEEIEKLIETYPEEHVFATALEVGKKNGVFPASYSIDTYKKNETYRLNYFKASLQVSVLHSSSTVIKKEIISRVGLFNANFPSGEDTDFWIRIGLHFPVIFSSNICVRYNFVPNSLSNRSKKLRTKPTYENYKEEEKENIPLKRFLDNNRYALAILAKLDHDKKGFQKMRKEITMENMNYKKRILLKTPRFLLKFALQLQQFLMKFGVYLTAFR